MKLPEAEVLSMKTLGGADALRSALEGKTLRVVMNVFGGDAGFFVVRRRKLNTR